MAYAGFVFLCIGFPAAIFGYLDPGSGSYFIQILLAGILGALFSIKMFWKRVAGWFRRPFGQSRQENEAGPPKKD